MTYTVVQELANVIQARQNCQRSENAEWLSRHEETIRRIARDYLPRGSGIDSGTTVDLDRSTGDKIVLQTAFHHMDESGGYDGWTEHTVTVRPAFVGLEITITGRNRNEIKEYLRDTFDCALGRELSEDERKAAHGV